MDHSFSSSKTYRYFTLGNQVKANKLLIVMHGYGQLAQFFLQKFNTCADSYFIVAPEGPHRFYKEGYSGRVGASWMTKEAREHDIQDNIKWLDALLTNLKMDKKFEDVILLGFSQGGATASRWYYNEPTHFDKLILWSSVFPPDIDKSIIKDGHNNLYVVGTKDEFIHESKRKEEINFYKSIGFSVSVYDGNHDIDKEVLKNLFQ